MQHTATHQCTEVHGSVYFCTASVSAQTHLCKACVSTQTPKYAHIPADVHANDYKGRGRASTQPLEFINVSASVPVSAQPLEYTNLSIYVSVCLCMCLFLCQCVCVCVCVCTAAGVYASDCEGCERASAQPLEYMLAAEIARGAGRHLQNARNLFQTSVALSCSACCRVLQCVTVYCSVLQCVALPRNLFQGLPARHMRWQQRARTSKIQQYCSNTATY